MIRASRPSAADSSRPTIARSHPQALAASILKIAVDAVDHRGHFTVVLAGGQTPHVVYREIDRLGSQSGVDWGRWRALLSDERCLPSWHEDRNDAVIARSMPSLIRAGGLRSMQVDRGAEHAVLDYERVIEDAGDIDLALLGLGADGHTASIFPQAVSDRAPNVDGGRFPSTCAAIVGAPEPYPERVTMTEQVLSCAREAWFFVDAEDRTKDTAVAELRRGEGVAAGITAQVRRIVLIDGQASGECSS